MLSDFKEGQLPFLVATDVASRGLHIEAVSHVINYDLPRTRRITSTGSAGRPGQGRKGRRSRWRARNSYSASRRSEELIGHKIPVEWASEEMFVEVGHGSRESPSAQAGRGESSARPRGGAPPGRGGGPHRRRRT